MNTTKSTVLNVKTSELLNQYYVTLETYGTTQCSDYPGGNRTQFQHLKGTDKNSGQVSFDWSVQDRSAICAEKAQVQSPEQVDIVYGTQPN